jgi:hypothetical protein
MRKPLNNPMPPQTSGIAKLLEQKVYGQAGKEDHDDGGSHVNGEENDRHATHHEGER